MSANEANYRWVDLRKHCRTTGDTPDAVEANIGRGRWTDGVHFRRDAAGNIEICVQAFNDWVTNGVKPERPAKVATEVLYRHYDKDDRLLYVGISAGHFARLAEHTRSSPWVTKIAKVTLEHFPDRASVRRAELQAIRTEKPIYNIAGKL